MPRSATTRDARLFVGRAIVLLGLVFLFPQVASAQCAMCRRALQSPEGQQMIAALQSGILFLLIAPFAVFATITVLAIRAERRRADEGCRSGAPSVDGCIRRHVFRRTIALG